METICSGLNVLELGSGSVAASIAGVVLADAGARVIKIEPTEGDQLRRDNPNGFLVWNRGKESLVADLRTAAGQQTVRGLAANADVVIEAFAPGRTAGWGIGPAQLRAENPALIHCSITGFGRTGPYAELKAYDPLVAAKVGLWARGAWAHRPGPIMFPVPWASFGAAMESVAAIMGALLVRERTGRGQALDSTLFAGLDPIDYFVSTVVQLMAKRGEKPSGDARSATSASRFAPKGPPASAASPAHSAPVPTPHAKPHSGAASLTGTGASRRVRQPPTAPARNGAASAARDSTGAGPLSGSAASIGSSGSGPSATPVGATTVSAPKAKPVPTA